MHSKLVSVIEHEQVAHAEFAAQYTKMMEKRERAVEEKAGGGEEGRMGDKQSQRE